MGFIKTLIVVLLTLLLVVIYFYFRYDKKPASNTSPSATSTVVTEIPETPLPSSSTWTQPSSSPPAGTPVSEVTPTSAPGSSPNLTGEDRDVFSKGMEHFNKMDYEKAIVCFKEVTQKNPKNIAAHYQLFLCYVQSEPDAWSRKSGTYRQAKQIMALGPDSKMKMQIETYFKDVASRESNVVEPASVIPSPSSSASGNPSGSPSVSATATPTALQTETFNTPPPLGLNTGVPTVSSKDADVHYERARNYDKIGNFRFAVAEYTAALKLNPRHFDAYVSRGSLYESKGEYGNAAGDYTKAISLKPQDAKNYYRRAMLYKLMQDREKAKADLLKAKEIEPAMSDKVDLILKELESQK